MESDLYFDTRNKKGRKYQYKKDKSIKNEKILKKNLSNEKNINRSEILDRLHECSWYRIRHHHQCHLCHPRKEKVNKEGKPKTIFRKKEYKNTIFDFSVI